MDLGKELFKMAKDMNEIRQQELKREEQIKMKCEYCIKTAEHGTRFCAFHLLEHKVNKGKEWARVLGIPKDKRYNAEHPNDTRYMTDWGNKTHIGIYEMIKRLVKEKGEM